MVAQHQAACNGKGTLPEWLTDPLEARQAALHYLREGINPIPVPASSKKPTLPEWEKLRPTEEDLDNLFPEGTPLNVGGLLGTASPVCPLDVDLDSPQALALAPVFLPPTHRISGRTGKARSHWWYRAPIGGTVGETVRCQDIPVHIDGKTKLQTLVELRSTGGQTLMPPSAYPAKDGGGQYLWDEYGEVPELDYADLLAIVQKLAAAAILARHWPNGSRHDAALALSGGLLLAGWTEEDTKTFVGAVVRTAGDEEVKDRVRAVSDTAATIRAGDNVTGWPKLKTFLDARVVDKATDWLGIRVQSGHRVQDEEPWPEPVPLNELPTVEPFPLSALPRALAQYVEEVAWSKCCPTDFVGTSLLGMAGGLIGNSRWLGIHDSHEQSPCLWCGVIGEPGSGKSPALEEVRKPLDAHERFHRRAWEKELEDWKESDADERGPKPILERLLLDDTTTERMAQLLNENPRGLIMLKDELLALICGLNQYKGGKGHDRQVYLKVWAHSTIEVDRKTNPDGAPIYVHRPFVSIVGGIQPGVIEYMQGERKAGKPPPDDGMLDRFLLSFPPDFPAVEETWRTVSRDASLAWVRTVEYLLGLQMVEEGDRDLRPFFVGLTLSDGRGEWQRFTRDHAAEMNAEDFPRYLRGPWAKFRGYCGRLALVCHYLRLACGEVKHQEVDGVSMARAALLVRYYKTHARKLHIAMDSDPRVADARRIRACLARHPDLATFSRAELYRLVRRHFKRPDALDAPLALLVEHQYLRQTTPEHKGKPGPHTARYQVNPKGRTDVHREPGEDEDL